MSEKKENNRFTLEYPEAKVQKELSETPMKIELKQSGNRHSRKLIQKLLEIVDLPAVAQDSIRQELEYATMDGYRITMKYNRNGETNDQEEQKADRFNR